MGKKASTAASAPSKASSKARTNSGFEKSLYLAIGAAVLLVALLIGAVHALKRARRAAKLRRHHMGSDEPVSPSRTHMHSCCMHVHS